jgi:pyruvate/2-oxoglutarate/acetoin dehydrogenase E1 component
MAPPRCVTCRRSTQALRDSLQRRRAGGVFGEDVAAAGGSFKATRGLLDAFGPERVRDTPISEATIVSAAVGAALGGLKPVVEIMFMDFVTLAMDALVNQAAKARFMFGGQGSVPMVLRTPHGGGLSPARSIRSAWRPGWRTCPGSRSCAVGPQDAYSLLRAAIADPDPVVFVEHKGLYARKGAVDTGVTASLGQARIVRPGRDLTLVSYGATVRHLPAGRAGPGRRRRRGRGHRPAQHPALGPRHRARVAGAHAPRVVVHEAVQAFGVGAEIVATLADEGFDDLDAPLLRVAAPFMPVPFATSLEQAYAVDAQAVITAARKTLA